MPHYTLTLTGRMAFALAIGFMAAGGLVGWLAHT